MGDMVLLAMINDPNIPDEQRAKEKEYKKYVDEHISNVKTAWNHMKANHECMDYIKSIVNDFYFITVIIDSLVASHDMSKYGLEEWEPYRKNFNPVNDEEKNDNIAAFEKAWEHHYMNNLHHWEYWYKTNTVDKMPIEFVVEMCCDWIAMSAKFGGTAYDWYNKQTNIVLGEQQKEWVVSLLKKFYSIK